MIYILKYKIEDTLYEIRTTNRKDAEDEIGMIFCVNESITAVVMQVYLDNGSRIKVELFKPHVGLYHVYWSGFDVIRKVKKGAKKKGDSLSTTK